MIWVVTPYALWWGDKIPQESFEPSMTPSAPISATRVPLIKTPLIMSGQLWNPLWGPLGARKASQKLEHTTDPPKRG